MLWNNDIEITFFIEALKNFAAPEQIFYKLNSEYYAYVPNGADGEGQTLQSRNSLIGQFTEKWCKNLVEPLAKKLSLYAVNGVICEKLGLTKRSSADLAFCTTDSVIQEPENVKLIFEIKMSVVSNYIYNKHENTIKFIGDYKQHTGNPSLLRSDSMLKAIGKSINIRVSSEEATKIPIIIIGNSPIQESYRHKVDFLKKSGVVQGFLSLNPRPTESSYIKGTSGTGFKTIENVNQLSHVFEYLIESDLNYFSSMISKAELGKIIQVACQEEDDIKKAEKFLSLIRSVT